MRRKRRQTSAPDEPSNWIWGKCEIIDRRCVKAEKSQQPLAMIGRVNSGTMMPGGSPVCRKTACILLTSYTYLAEHSIEHVIKPDYDFAGNSS